MSDNDARPAVAISGTALVWAIALMFAVTVAGAVVLAVFLPSDSATALVGALLAAFALLTTNLGTLFKIGKVEAKVHAVTEDTARIVEQTNGNLDKRIRTLSYESMRKALEDHLEADPGPTG